MSLKSILLISSYITGKWGTIKDCRLGLYVRFCRRFSGFKRYQSTVILRQNNLVKF